MGLVTGGFGHIPAITTGGFGVIMPQTAHPSEYNTPICDPLNLSLPTRGTDGDPEYCVAKLTPESPFNGRAILVYLPEDKTLGSLPPRVLSALENIARLIKPMTCGVHFSSVKAAIGLAVLDEIISR